MCLDDVAGINRERHQNYGSSMLDATWGGDTGERIAVILDHIGGLPLRFVQPFYTASAQGFIFMRKS